MEAVIKVNCRNPAVAIKQVLAVSGVDPAVCANVEIRLIDYPRTNGTIPIFRDVPVVGGHILQRVQKSDRTDILPQDGASQHGKIIRIP